MGEVGQCRAGRDDLDPALDKGQHGLQTSERAALVRRRRQCKHAAAERRLYGRRVRGVDRTGRLGDRLRIDRDLRGVALDRAYKVTLQPRHGREETSVGGLADSEELTNLVEGDVEPLGELGNVVRQESRVRGVRQGNACVVGAEGLACQSCQDARDLRGEHHRGQARHHLLRLAQHRSHAVGQRRGILEAVASKLLGQCGAERPRHVQGDRLADALPRGDRVLHPRHPAPHASGHGPRSEIRDGVEPQVGDRHRLTRCLGLGGRGGRIAAGVGSLLRAVLHQAPIHRARRRIHEELELAHRRAHARRIGKLRGQVRGIKALGLQSASGLRRGLVAQHGAQEILKGGAGLVLVHDVSLASARATGLTNLCKNAES